METMCTERRKQRTTQRFQGEKKRGGISFTMDLATTERSGEVESRPNKKRDHKSFGAQRGGGGCMGAPVKECCWIWTIVSRSPLMLPDKRLCHSSIQEPAHSLRQLLSDREKRSKYVSDELKLHEQSSAPRPCSGEPV